MKLAFSTVYMAAVVSNATRSPARIMLPASQLSGDDASGSESRARTARQADRSPHAGDHSFFRMSKQMSPVRKCTLGWKTWQEADAVPRG
jgi:hypothetical protein